MSTKISQKLFFTLLYFIVLYGTGMSSFDITHICPYKAFSAMTELFLDLHTCHALEHK